MQKTQIDSANVAEFINNQLFILYL